VLPRLSILGLVALALCAATQALSAAPAAAAPGLRFLDAKRVGLGDPRSLVASPDGRSLYAASRDADAVLSFRTRPLRLQSCFSANAKVRCKRLPGAGSEDAVSGFNGVRFVTVSPDGRSVYTVSANDDSIGIFARKTSGQLNYKGCLTGSVAPNSSGKRRICRTIPTATPVHEGIHSGLGGPASLSVSPDGRFVYVASRADAAIATFAREPNGLLSFRGCLSGGISAIVVGFSSPCTMVAPENWHSSGLRSVTQIAISSDGTSLYASGPRASAVTEFQRDPATGQLTYRGCLTGESRGLEPSNPCRPVPTAQEAGFGSGLWLIDALEVSPDGRSLYGVAKGDDAIAAFSRDPATGALTYIESDPALDQPRDLAISPSGRSVYVASAGDAVVLRLARNPGSGSLAFAGAQPGSGALDSLALAGRTLYAGASRQAMISRYAISGG
jgi:6-phosphogluconolactonase (cycloisomerase 2 family)